jgi:hypothetical protein
MAHPTVVSAARSQAAGEGTVISQHAWKRVIERLTPAEQQQFFRVMSVLEPRLHLYAGEDLAIRVLKLSSQRGLAFGNKSNGDAVWLVVRRGVIKTVMLRRSTQPNAAWAMSVDRAVLL